MRGLLGSGKLADVALPAVCSIGSATVAGLLSGPATCAVRISRFPSDAPQPRRVIDAATKTIVANLINDLQRFQPSDSPIERAAASPLAVGGR
jgi:hypothetical protein